MDLLSLLAEGSVSNPDQVSSLLHDAGGVSATPSTIEAALVRGGVALGTILKVKGDYYQVPTRELGKDSVPFEILRYVPEESARYYRFAPLAVKDGALEVGVTDPDNLEARDALNFISGKVGMLYKFFLISGIKDTGLFFSHQNYLHGRDKASIL